MSDKVVYLHDRRPHDVAQVVRIGFFDHRRAEHLWSANELTARRFVIEAANVQRQAGLLRTLRDAGAEIALDTNVAELSVKGRFGGAVRTAPYAPKDWVLEPDEMVAGSTRCWATRKRTSWCSDPAPRRRSQ